MPAASKIESFWDFSVRTYRTTGVPDACLSPQNDYGADVNMLLYCCWIGPHAGQFDAQLFAQATRFSTQWADNVVKPLRCARTWMKHTGCLTDPVATEACMDLRDKIKSVEFAAEKLQQETLESLVSINPAHNSDANQVLTDVMANLNRYAEFADINDCADVRRKLGIIIDAAFPS
jgi:uncharacterized protein (TIGR02444 family)